MKKLFSALISAALIAMPLALISTPASATTMTKAKASKVKHAKKSKTKAKAKAHKPAAQVLQ